MQPSTLVSVLVFLDSWLKMINASNAQNFALTVHPPAVQNVSQELEKTPRTAVVSWDTIAITIDVKVVTTPYVTNALNKVLSAINALLTQKSDLRMLACARKGTTWMKIAVLSALALLKAVTQMDLSLNVV